jgi:signal transduction histidine kinase
MFEKRGTKVEMEDVSLLPLVTELARSLEFRAEDHGRHIEVWPGSTDVTVWCSKYLVKVAVFALIENAIEYGGDNDTISVRVRGLPNSSGQYVGRIEVIDHGESIPPELRPGLFNPERAERSATGRQHHARHPNSSGIGLDHVRRIVREVHGGEARYKQDWRGKVFSLDFLQDGDGGR